MLCVCTIRLELAVVVALKLLALQELLTLTELPPRIIACECKAFIILLLLMI